MSSHSSPISVTETVHRHAETTEGISEMIRVATGFAMVLQDSVREKEIRSYSGS